MNICVEMFVIKLFYILSICFNVISVSAADTKTLLERPLPTKMKTENQDGVLPAYSNNKRSKRHMGCYEFLQYLIDKHAYSADQYFANENSYGPYENPYETHVPSYGLIHSPPSPEVNDFYNEGLQHSGQFYQAPPNIYHGFDPHFNSMPSFGLQTYSRRKVVSRPKTSTKNLRKRPDCKSKLSNAKPSPTSADTASKFHNQNQEKPSGSINRNCTNPYRRIKKIKTCITCKKCSHSNQNSPVVAQNPVENKCGCLHYRTKSAAENSNTGSNSNITNSQVVYDVRSQNETSKASLRDSSVTVATTEPKTSLPTKSFSDFTSSRSDSSLVQDSNATSSSVFDQAPSSSSNSTEDKFESFIRDDSIDTSMESSTVSTLSLTSPSVLSRETGAATSISNTKSTETSNFSTDSNKANMESRFESSPKPSSSLEPQNSTYDSISSSSVTSTSDRMASSDTAANTNATSDSSSSSSNDLKSTSETISSPHSTTNGNSTSAYSSNSSHPETFTSQTMSSSDSTSNINSNSGWGSSSSNDLKSTSETMSAFDSDASNVTTASSSANDSLKDSDSVTSTSDKMASSDTASNINATSDSSSSSSNDLKSTSETISSPFSTTNGNSTSAYSSNSSHPETFTSQTMSSSDSASYINSNSDWGSPSSDYKKSTSEKMSSSDSDASNVTTASSSANDSLTDSNGILDSQYARNLISSHSSSSESDTRAVMDETTYSTDIPFQNVSYTANQFSSNSSKSRSVSANLETSNSNSKYSKSSNLSQNSKNLTKLNRNKYSWSKLFKWGQNSNNDEEYHITLSDDDDENSYVLSSEQELMRNESKSESSRSKVYNSEFTSTKEDMRSNQSKSEKSTNSSKYNSQEEFNTDDNEDGTSVRTFQKETKSSFSKNEGEKVQEEFVTTHTKDEKPSMASKQEKTTNPRNIESESYSNENDDNSFSNENDDESESFVLSTSQDIGADENESGHNALVKNKALSDDLPSQADDESRSIALSSEKDPATSVIQEKHFSPTPKNFNMQNESVTEFTPDLMNNMTSSSSEEESKNIKHKSEQEEKSMNLIVLWKNIEKIANLSNPESSSESYGSSSETLTLNQSQFANERNISRSKTNMTSSQWEYSINEREDDDNPFNNSKQLEAQNATLSSSGNGLSDKDNNQTIANTSTDDPETLDNIKESHQDRVSNSNVLQESSISSSEEDYYSTQVLSDYESYFSDETNQKNPFTLSAKDRNENDTVHTIDNISTADSGNSDENFHDPLSEDNENADVAENLSNDFNFSAFTKNHSEDVETLVNQGNENEFPSTSANNLNITDASQSKNSRTLDKFFYENKTEADIFRQGHADEDYSAENLSDDSSFATQESENLSHDSSFVTEESENLSDDSSFATKESKKVGTQNNPEDINVIPSTVDPVTNFSVTDTSQSTNDPRTSEFFPGNLTEAEILKESHADTADDNYSAENLSNDNFSAENHSNDFSSSAFVREIGERENVDDTTLNGKENVLLFGSRLSETNSDNSNIENIPDSLAIEAGKSQENDSGSRATSLSSFNESEEHHQDTMDMGDTRFSSESGSTTIESQPRTESFSTSNESERSQDTAKMGQTAISSESENSLSRIESRPTTASFGTSQESEENNQDTMKIRQTESSTESSECGSDTKELNQAECVSSSYRLGSRPKSISFSTFQETKESPKDAKDIPQTDSSAENGETASDTLELETGSLSEKSIYMSGTDSRYIKTESQPKERYDYYMSDATFAEPIEPRAYTGRNEFQYQSHYPPSIYWHTIESRSGDADGAFRELRPFESDDIETFHTSEDCGDMELWDINSHSHLGT